MSIPDFTIRIFGMEKVRGRKVYCFDVSFKEPEWQFTDYAFSIYADTREIAWGCKYFLDLSTEDQEYFRSLAAKMF